MAASTRWGQPAYTATGNQRWLGPTGGSGYSSPHLLTIDNVPQIVLLTVGDALGGKGNRRIAVTHEAGGWRVTERWTSRGLKPYFNDFVVHEGHAFGFDGRILASINLENGERAWKGGRYGHGQLVVLPEQDLLLVRNDEEMAAFRLPVTSR